MTMVLTNREWERFRSGSTVEQQEDLSTETFAIGFGVYRT